MRYGDVKTTWSPKVLCVTESPQKMKERRILVGREEKSEASEPLWQRISDIYGAQNQRTGNVASAAMSRRALASISVIVRYRSVPRRIQCIHCKTSEVNECLSIEHADDVTA